MLFKLNTLWGFWSAASLQSASESDDDAFEEDEEFSLPPELLPELAKKKETTIQ